MFSSLIFPKNKIYAIIVIWLEMNMNLIQTSFENGFVSFLIYFFISMIKLHMNVYVSSEK